MIAILVYKNYTKNQKRKKLVKTQ